MIPDIDRDDPEGWREWAACRDADPDLFFPNPTDYDRIAAAKRICDRCPSVGACAEYAISINERNGIWGGMTEDERRLYRRRVLRARRLGQDVPDIPGTVLPPDVDPPQGQLPLGVTFDAGS